ncbi:putative endonuclease/exonuclease/phosphatase domain-containing protein [Neospora caninum Liverpool]|uniref:Putative endonuclease/exonuclease/phosphatase domain-containing protein n=1 Tax=Neospora caninum (strain Liverpool) TaxID=572307 RepID=F0VN37_NEOCL|nr:putative endonuclease/exonuclease/phosphatase domain-containing protein [Neospora caninum Liverpool]CBZ55133.1 putative endonuclease/exonuclease/phosphatase domain-containing protein [Neospora caninum Liverpool]|eukprot:XP_003885161.1 putative endonuclease/exonuclease/phosphatase domain-containing protein [Neospora caninum Liverpool]
MSTEENWIIEEDAEGQQTPTAQMAQWDTARTENSNTSSNEASNSAYAARVSGSEGPRSLHMSFGVSSTASSDASEGVYGPNLRILVLNAYLVPPSITWNPYLWAPFWSCKRPYQRAEDVGHLAAQYDIACLQEVWGTNMAAMNAHVLPTHSILPQTQSGSRFPCVGEMIDPLQFYWKKTGGLWFAWRRSKCAFISMASHYFPSGSQMPFSNQNVTAVELDVSPVFPKHRIIVLNTHFSILGVKSRRVNLESYTYFTQETFTEKKKKHSVLRKGNSLYPWPFKGRVDYMFAVDEVRLSSQEVLDLVENFPPEVVIGDDYEEMDIPVLKDGSLVILFKKIYCLGMDIVAQRQGFELSDHWPLRAGRSDSKVPTTDRNFKGADQSRQRRVTAMRDFEIGPADRARLVQEFGYKGRLTVGRQRPTHAAGQRPSTTAPSEWKARTVAGTVTTEETVESDEEEKQRWKIAEHDPQSAVPPDAEDTQTEEVPLRSALPESRFPAEDENIATPEVVHRPARVPLAMKRAQEVQQARAKAMGEYNQQPLRRS